ncbi:MAG: hypothetical protein LCH54_16580 [Bacteroidetes bacterium]|nr:hypothetical protein [Bacteroidota bacterium]
MIGVFRFSAIIFLLLFSLPAFAQPEFSGNLQWMGISVKPGRTIFSRNTDLKQLNQGSLYLNAGYSFSERLTFQSEFRTRFLHGETSSFSKMISDGSTGSTDQFLINKTWKLNKNNTADFRVNRFYLDYNDGPLLITAGRQRINWGMAMIWNPVDIFNARNAVTFGDDLPSSDAVRIQFYTSETNSFDLVVKGSETRAGRAWALRFKGNMRSTDFQVFGGQRHDIPVAGFGWSGEFLKGGFRGEVLGQFNSFNSSYYRFFPSETGSIYVKTREETPNVQAVVSYDYTFENSLYLLTECLWSPSGQKENVLFNILNAADNQWLSPGVLNLAHQAGYDLTPLVRIGGIYLWNATDYSLTAGPTLNWNLSDNLDLNGMLLFSDGNNTSEYGGIGTIGFMRVKWSF